MNPQQPAVLFPRRYRLKNGRTQTVWWYYVTTQDGRRVRRSLHTTSKTQARTWLLEKLKAGELWPARGVCPRLREFTRTLWDWENGSYVARKRLRGERLTPQWALQNRGYLENHILPVLGNRRLNDIHARDIERFLIRLRHAKGLSNKSLNNLLGCLRIVFDEARRPEEEGHGRPHNYGLRLLAGRRPHGHAHLRRGREQGLRGLRQAHRVSDRRHLQAGAPVHDQRNSPGPGQER